MEIRLYMEYGKIDRVLGIYTKLMEGYSISKPDEADAYGVNERTIQRDIDDIRDFIESSGNHTGFVNSVVYDRFEKKYHLEEIYHLKLTNGEILAICKILLDSRAFVKEEMIEMIDTLISCCIPKENQKLVRKLIKNEEFHYVELQHKTKFIDMLWNLGEAISKCRLIDISYKRTKDKKLVKRKLKPLAIMFSEYYFYLTAFIDDENVRKDFDVINDSFPTIYRIDRIKTLNVLNESFHIPYSSRFEEGEFRKRIQFMYGGKLQKVRFKFCGNDVEPILDRLPTAKIIDKDDEGYIITAEVFGEGIYMWVRRQGELIKNFEIL